MRPRWIAAGLALASFAATHGEACKRRLRDLIPPAGERAELEDTLLDIVEQLEDCVEVGAGPKEERHAKLVKALARWDELRTTALAAPPPKAMTVPPEEYRLILESIDDLAQSTRRAWDAGDLAEAERQEVALQHVVGELYGSNPGKISMSRAVHYTVTTFEWLPPLATTTVDAWNVRAELLHLRLNRWVGEVGADADKLGMLRLLRSGVAGLRFRLAGVGDRKDAGAEPLRTLYVAEATAAIKDLDALAKRAPGAVLRASWSRKGVPKDLQALPPREAYPGLDRP